MLFKTTIKVFLRNEKRGGGGRRRKNLIDQSEHLTFEACDWLKCKGCDWLRCSCLIPSNPGFKGTEP